MPFLKSGTDNTVQQNRGVLDRKLDVMCGGLWHVRRAGNVRLAWVTRCLKTAAMFADFRSRAKKRA